MVVKYTQSIFHTKGFSSKLKGFTIALLQHVKGCYSHSIPHWQPISLMVRKVIPIAKHCEGLSPDPGPQKDWALTIRLYSNYSPSHFTTIIRRLQKKSSELQVKGQQEEDSLWGGILREAPSQNVIQKQEHLRNLKPLTTIPIADIKQNPTLTQININHQNNVLFTSDSITQYNLSLNKNVWHT